MYKQKGSLLPQYIIIIAVVILALIPVFIVFGGNIYAHFENFYNTLSKKETLPSKITTNSSGKTTSMIAGSLGGTPEKPVLQCSDGNCNVDYGDFILTGIPENFNEFVESHGTSGGTEKIVTLLLQMARQLEEDGLEEQASDIRDIANLCHYIAQIESEHEDYAKDCSNLSSANQIMCLTNYMYSNPTNTIVPPDNISDLIPGFTNLDFFQVGFDKTRDAIDIGSAIWSLSAYDSIIKIGRNIDKQYIEEQMKAESLKTPANAIAYKYLKVMKDSSIPDSVKNVSKSMVNYINEMALEQITTMININGNLADGIAYMVYDVETGKFTSKTIVETEIATTGTYEGQEVVKGDGRILDLNRIIVPHYSVKTNLSSAIICVSGKHRTTGKSCH